MKELPTSISEPNLSTLRTNKDKSIQLTVTKTHTYNLLGCTRIHLPTVHINSIEGQSRSEPNLSTRKCNCKDSKWSDHQNALLTSYLITSLQYCDHIAIAVEECTHCESQYYSLPSFIRKTIDKLSHSLAHGNPSLMERITLIPIKHWGKFTPALNTLLNFAANMGYDRILYQSLEVRVNDLQAVPLLLNELNFSDTLVVGASFSQYGHQIHATEESDGERTVELNGVTSPWNTFAIWNTCLLSKTGFLPISDGLIKGVHGGVEEVSVIALQQMISSPSLCKAKVIDVQYRRGLQKIGAINDNDHDNDDDDGDDGDDDDGVENSPSFPRDPVQSNDLIFEWITEGFGDDERRKIWHNSKMSSKLIRAASQTSLLQLPPGQVIHKVISIDPPQS